MNNKNKKEDNPFAGLDGTSTPQQLLQALMKKAIDDNDMRPIGGVIGMIQKQVEATMQHLGKVMQQLRQEVGQSNMVSDVTRLTIALLIKIMVDKDIITKEEFDGLYKKNVTDVMDNHVKELEKKQKELEEEEKKRIEEFAKKAAENPDAMIDPDTGEIISNLEEPAKEPVVEARKISKPLAEEKPTDEVNTDLSSESTKATE